MSYGTVIKFSTGEVLGVATLEDWLESAVARLTAPRTGVFMRDDGYAVRVSGGPSHHVDPSDIASLRNKALRGANPDPGALELYARALDGDEAAFRSCAVAILAIRAETHPV